MSKKHKNNNKNKVSVILPPCHKHCVEIADNFFIGSYKQCEEMVFTHNVDILIPLDSLDGKIWDWGFRGEIWYYPISDFDILPSDVLLDLIEKILTAIQSGKKVGMFCIGGHGRTGYVASCVLGFLDKKDPIEYIRNHYCEKAVETNSQIRHIAEILDKPELYEKHKIIFPPKARLYASYDNYDYMGAEEWWIERYPELKDSFGYRDNLFGY